jgi:hypothetical protein
MKVAWHGVPGRLARSAWTPGAKCLENEQEWRRPIGTADRSASPKDILHGILCPAF